MPSTTPSRGNILYGFVCGPLLTPVSVAANTSAEQSFTVPGLQLNDIVDVNLFGAVQTAGVGITNARVSAANTLTLLFTNSTSGGVIPAAGTYAIVVTRPENVPLPTSAV